MTCEVPEQKCCAISNGKCCPTLANVVVDDYGNCRGRVAAVPQCLYCPTSTPNEYLLVVISIPPLATGRIFCFVCSHTIVWGDRSVYDQNVSTCESYQKVHTYGGGGTYYLWIFIALLTPTTVCGNVKYANLTEDPKDPAKYRSIALTSCIAKLYTSILKRRLESFMLRYGYIKPNLQRAFLPGIRGCNEHQFRLWRALQDARLSQRNLCAIWLDLAL